MKLIKPIAITIALGCSVPAYAVMPKIDIAELQVTMQETMQRGLEHSKKILLKAQEQMAKAEETAMQIDNKNNAVANVIARKGAALQEILDLEQLSRSAPAQAACSALSLSHNLNQTLCSEEIIRDMIRNKLMASSPSPLEMHADKELSSPSGGGTSRSAGISMFSAGSGRTASGTSGGSSGGSEGSSPASGVTATAQAWEDLNQEQDDAIDRIVNKTWGTADGDPTDPLLLLVNGLDTYQYTEEQKNKVLDISKIVYPYYVRKSLTDPVNKREVSEEERARAIVDFGNSVIQRQIALKMSPDEDENSILMSMSLPVELIFEGIGDGEEMSSNPSKERMRLATGSDVGVAETDRAELLNKAVEVHQMIETWKSMLIKEQALATLFLTRSNPPKATQ